jgi:hypothetical protein
VKRTGAAFTLDAAAWEPLFDLIPTALRATGPVVKYLPVLITGGGNHILAAASLSAGGPLTLRSTSTSHAVNTGSLFTINVTYFI